MIAKGKVFVSKDKMREILSLPDGVEVLAVKPKELDDGFEFLVVSAEDTIATRITDLPLRNIRRVSVETLENAKNQNTFIKADTIRFSDVGLEVLHTGEVVLSQKDIDKIDRIAQSIKEKSDNESMQNITINVTKQDEKDVQAIFEEITNKLNQRRTK